MHGQDVRVLQSRGEVDLADESFGAKGLSQFGVEDLERHQPVVLEVAGEVDRGHPAPAQLTLEHICAAQGRLERRPGVWHSFRMVVDTG